MDEFLHVCASLCEVPGVRGRRVIKDPFMLGWVVRTGLRPNLNHNTRCDIPTGHLQQCLEPAAATQAPSSGHAPHQVGRNLTLGFSLVWQRYKSFWRLHLLSIPHRLQGQLRMVHTSQAIPTIRTMLCLAALFAVLRRTMLHDTTLHDATRRYATLRNTTLHYTTLHYTTLHYTRLRYTTLHYTMP